MDCSRTAEYNVSKFAPSTVQLCCLSEGGVSSPNRYPLTIEVELRSPLIFLSRTAVSHKNVIRSVNGQRVHRLCTICLARL